MNYIPSLLNKNLLFLRYASFLNPQDEMKNQKIIELLFRACNVLINLESIADNEQLIINLVNSYNNQLAIPNHGRIAVAASPLFLMSSQIGIALNSICVMQNLILNIAQSIGIIAMKVNLPSSFNKLIKNPKKYIKDKSIIDVFENYWASNGKMLRHMRDIDQHFESLIGQSYYENCDIKPNVSILLPDNPEVKSPKKFKYENKLNAFDFLKTSFYELHGLYDALAKMANKEPGQHKSIIDMKLIGSLVPEQERTLALHIDILGANIENSSIKYELNTVEIRQIIPNTQQSGNIELRHLKTDAENSELSSN